MRARAHVERREAARRRIGVAGWRPGETVEVRYAGEPRVARIGAADILYLLELDGSSGAVSGFWISII
jgi:hypothetical protein